MPAVFRLYWGDPRFPALISALHLRHLLRVRESESSKLNPSFLRYEADLIEVLVARGRFAEAKRFLADFELLARKTHSSWAAIAISRCRALAASGDFSLDLFRQAIKIGRELATDYEQGRTVLCFAERLQELGYLSQSDQQRIKAKALFDELSAPAWPERRWGGAEGKKNSRLKRFGKTSPLLSIEVRQLALPVSAAANSLNPTSAVTQRVLEGAELTASLTNGERQVVVHVLAGLRNKEIAALLEVSLRTVETRLTNVYKKTGASSRAHLVSLASETR
ncbi:response regulator transcription factor [Renibacterium salmoninarum]|uniref:response regulator transcription factor n=1 Tax=Renibacterium salmoninarum TaxID=1646 RepID=UPI0009B5C95B|nr:LuxR family transcriptional regulator [Renibacterium salmoninarum]